MEKVRNILSVFLGIILKSLFRNGTVENLMIIGSSSGYGFNDNGKHLFLYWYSNNKNAYFVTKSYTLYKQLKQKYGSRILYNYSLSGINKIVRARYYFFTHNESDVIFALNKSTKIICLFHGMPIKKIGNDYKGKGVRKNRIMSWLFRNYVVGFRPVDFHLIVSTSAFFKEYLASAFQNNSVAVMSYPRINYLMENMATRKTENGQAKKTILYMPTHRDYGHGQLNPFIFHDNQSFNKYLTDADYQIKYRFHPNMKSKLNMSKEAAGLDEKFDFYPDAQDALLHTDILITDYSSCIYDYLVCEKPIVFFLYDNYEENDNNLYYKIESLGIGPIAKSEDELQGILKRIISDANYEESLISNIKENKHKYISVTKGWDDYARFFN